MTRENKLALIIGFSLILVVAILLADHLSPAQQSEMNALDSMFADTPSIDLPASGSDRDAAEESSIPRSPGRTTMGLGQMRRDQGDPQDWPLSVEIPIQQEQSLGDTWIMGRELPEGSAAADDGASIHVVLKDETLYGIARRYYGDGSLHEALAEANSDRVAGDGKLRAGMTLFIPSREALIGRAPGPSGSPTDSNSPTTYEQYTIKQNDRLWDIAKEFLGKGHRYKEIADINKDVIKNVDVLPVGKTIRIPPR